MTTLQTLDHIHLNTTSRPLQTETDFWRVRDLLIEIYPLAQPGWNWEIRRWEGRRFYADDISLETLLDQSPVQLWETTEGKLVGAAHTEGRLGEAFLTLHPTYRHLEAEMIDWAEANLAKTDDNGQRSLEFSVFEYDVPRLRLLTERGYERGCCNYLRFMRLSTYPPLPPVIVPDGYTVRSTEPTPDDTARIVDVLNHGFGSTGNTMTNVTNFRTHATFQHDLDMVAVAPDGTFVAYAGGLIVDPNLFALFEPVCTHPDHRQKGLAKACMIAALHRMRAAGVPEVRLDTWDNVAANRLYDSVGFTESYRCYTWKKTW